MEDRGVSYNWTIHGNFIFFCFVLIELVKERVIRGEQGGIGYEVLDLKQCDGETDILWARR